MPAVRSLLLSAQLAGNTSKPSIGLASRRKRLGPSSQDRPLFPAPKPISSAKASRRNASLLCLLERSAAQQSCRLVHGGPGDGCFIVEVPRKAPPADAKSTPRRRCPTTGESRPEPRSNPSAPAGQRFARKAFVAFPGAEGPPRSFSSQCTRPPAGQEADWLTTGWWSFCPHRCERTNLRSASSRRSPSSNTLASIANEMAKFP